jgi:hypothetical protein
MDLEDGLCGERRKPKPKLRTGHVPPDPRKTLVATPEGGKWNHSTIPH